MPSHQFPSREEQDRFCDLLAAISARPKMYTPNGTLNEVALYVDGYVHGAGFPRGEVNNEPGMMAFARWLQMTRNVIVDCRRWEHVVLAYCEEDEEEALKGLGLLYRESVDA